jgi:hypothetical protein
VYRLAVVSLVAAVVLGSVAPVALADTEPNDELDVADRVTVGVTESGTIENGDDVDWYRFDVTRGEAIEAVGARPAGTDGGIAFRLYGPSGESLTGAFTAESGETVVAGDVAETTGTYYVRVNPNFGTGDYSLNVTTPANDAVESNERLANATVLFENPRGPIDGTITENDLDYFAVEATAGDRIAVTASAPASETVRTKVEFLDPSGDQLNGTFATPGETSTASAIAGSTGTYYVRSSVDLADGAAYTANVTVAGEPRGLPNDRFEPNENASDPAEVAPGTVENLAMVDDDRDYVAVEAEAGDRIDASIAFDGSANDLTLRLFGPGETLLRESATDADRESVTVTATRNGTHYVAVTGESGAVATYSLSTAVTSPIDLAIGPGAETVRPGNTTTYDVTLADAAAGVGSFEFVVESSNDSVATPSGARAVDGTANVTTAPDGSLGVSVTNASIESGDAVTIARVTVRADAEGTATVNVSDPSIGIRTRTATGITYPVSRIQGTTVTVSNDTLATLFPDGVPGSPSGQQPTDVDGDGVFEDVNCDERFDFRDVVDLLFALGRIQAEIEAGTLSSAEIESLDHSADDRVTFDDVVDLLFEL